MMRTLFDGDCDRCGAGYHSEVAPIQDDWSEIKVVRLNVDAKPEQFSYVMCSTCTLDFDLFWNGNGDV